MTTFHQTLMRDNLITSHNRVSSTCNMGRTILCQKLENIEEDTPANWTPAPTAVVAAAAPHQPETPTESMEFLGRSWSLSATELSQALFNTSSATATAAAAACPNHHSSAALMSSLAVATAQESSTPVTISRDYLLPKLPSRGSPPISPRTGTEMKRLYKSVLRGKTMGQRLKDQKEKKKQEARTQNAQIHAAVSVAGVAAAVAAIAASNAMAAEIAGNYDDGRTGPGKSTAAIASASALVASHCIELAEDMGADHNQISTAVNSTINARTNGDIMALTAGAATALRGAAILRARLLKNYGTTSFSPAEETGETKESSVSTALNLVCRGEELLKRTRKGDLHWKQVSFKINSNWQVVVKMKSKYIGGAFTKKKKCVIYGVCGDIPRWPQRRLEDNGEQRAYFGIKTTERVIEFECGSKIEKQMWIDGIQHLLNSIRKVA